MMDLDSIGVAEGTDKATMAHGKPGHGYTRIYELWFNAIRDKPIILLEIGIHKGASLRMWDCYFTNPQTQLFGVDIDPTCTLLQYKSGRVCTIGADQAKLAVCSWIRGRTYDIIIDDGSHKWKDQQEAFKVLWPMLAHGGMYWIEDVFSSYEAKYGDPHTTPTAEWLRTFVNNPEWDVMDIHFWNAVSPGYMDEKPYMKLAMLRKR